MVSCQPPSIFSMLVTGVLRYSSTPLRTATSAMASANSHGLTMAALGANSAPATVGASCGSIGTPFATPFAYSFCRWGSSAWLSASTRLPHWR